MRHPTGVTKRYERPVISLRNAAPSANSSQVTQEGEPQREVPGGGRWRSGEGAAAGASLLPSMAGYNLLGDTPFGWWGRAAEADASYGGGRLSGRLGADGRMMGAGLLSPPLPFLPPPPTTTVEASEDGPRWNAMAPSPPLPLSSSSALSC